MIVVIGFCPKDEDLMLQNARWWNELGGCEGHQLLVCYDPRCNPDTVEAIRVELDKSFDKLWRLNNVEAVDDWPQGANYFFKLSCTWLESKREWPSFFWTEPDAIPLTPGWLDAIAVEYKRGGKPFMGDRVEVTINGKEVPLHMSGVGVYENPIYLKAGEAYRAYDVAWDMAAKDQIVPHAYFTKVIEHAWKHPTFRDQSELSTQIRKEAVIFHSSKDGSLINLLQQKRGGKQLQAEGRTPVSTSALPTVKEPDKPGSPSPLPTYDIFIRTYPGDYEWLAYCLDSIYKFTSGFRKVWIVSPGTEPVGTVPSDMTSWTEWKVMNDETEDGYLAQQITKLYADVLTDYQPDYILHVDSDIVFTRPTTPGDFFQNGKMIWYYTAYSAIQTPWQPIIEKFMCCTVGSEYMRRLPMMVPRWLYPKLREFCHKQHGIVISEYIRAQPHRSFSEFNALGAFASLKHDQEFSWVDTTLPQMPPPFAKQFHSWSGLTPEVKSEIDQILQGGVPVARHAHNVEVVGSIPTPAIKKLPNDVWIIAGDQIGNWIEQTSNRLDHDPNLLPVICSYIKEQDTVIDIGAYIGDHTIAYARKAKTVHAFEPHPLAYECLSHNMEKSGNVTLYSVVLGDKQGSVPLSANNGELDGCYVGEHMSIGNIMMRRLDDYPEIKPDFIKIDVEGYEPKVLEGATKTIEKYHPTMVIEINQSALERQGATPDHIFGWLTQHCYGWRIIEENALRNDPLYNIIALPAVDKPGSAQASAETPAPERIDVSASASTPSPQVSLTVLGSIKHYVARLKDIVETSSKNKSRVMQQLVYAGLRKPNKKARRKRKRSAKKHEG